MTAKQPNIVDVVQQSPELSRVVNELLELNFLLPGAFRHDAYMVDTERIEGAWEQQTSRTNAIAKGVLIYNQFFYEIGSAALLNKSPSPSATTNKRREKWKQDIQERFEDEHQQIEEVCRTIGQYLEFMNRKSQGF